MNDELLIAEKLHIKKLHKQDSADPVYMEGYNTSRNKKNWHSPKNPYKYPQRTSDAEMRIATSLFKSEKDARMMQMWRKRFQNTKWARWSNGYWAREQHKKLKLDV